MALEIDSSLWPIGLIAAPPTSKDERRSPSRMALGDNRMKHVEEPK